jgi:hypothetical protein
MNGNGRRFNNNRNNNNRRYNNNNRNSNNNGNRRFSGSNIDDESVNISPQQRRNFENKRDQYLMKAKEALSAGDKVEAENMFQHADHYFRMANLGLPPKQERHNHDHGGHHHHDNHGDRQGDSNVPEYVSNVPHENSSEAAGSDIASLPFLQAEIPAPNSAAGNNSEA